MTTNTHTRWMIVVALLGSACLSVQAGAQTTDQLGGPNTIGVFGTAAVDVEELAISRGGTELTLNDLKSDGIVGNNRASNLVTGTNLVTDGSFAGATGFATVVQNSGNNVLIQNATIINLQVK